VRASNHDAVIKTLLKQRRSMIIQREAAYTKCAVVNSDMHEIISIKHYSFSKHHHPTPTLCAVGDSVCVHLDHG
jgi:hypothetical protein